MKADRFFRQSPSGLPGLPPHTPPNVNFGPPSGATAILMLVGLIGLCLLAGAAGGAVTQQNLYPWYESLTRPPGVPPNEAFGPIWTTLDVAMGVAAWRVWRRAGRGRILWLWGWQLGVNAAWPPVFFGLHALAPAIAVIVALWVLISLTIRAFARVDGLAALLMAPYLAWVSYAAYLNAGFWWLNRM